MSIPQTTVLRELSECLDVNFAAFGMVAFLYSIYEVVFSVQFYRVIVSYQGRRLSSDSDSE